MLRKIQCEKVVKSDVGLNLTLDSLILQVRPVDVRNEQRSAHRSILVRLDSFSLSTLR